MWAGGQGLPLHGLVRAGVSRGKSRLQNCCVILCVMFQVEGTANTKVPGCEGLSILQEIAQKPVWPREYTRPVCLEPGNWSHGGILGSRHVTIKWGLSGRPPNLIQEDH